MKGRENLVPFDKETASAAGKKGAAVRKEKAEKARKRPASLDEITEESLYGELYAAAFGLHGWGKLDAGKRLAALKLLLEYKVGRPRQRAQDEVPEDTDWGISVAQD